MKKVTITTREVYHKIASVTIDVPSDIGEDEVQQWLWDNEELFTSELDTSLDNAEYEYGFGLAGDNGMNEVDSVSETRYDLIENDKIKYGGHL